MVRKINAEGLAMVKRFEGLQRKAYQDTGGVWTIGYGHTSAAGLPQVKPGMTITEPLAEDILMKDLSGAEEDVTRLVKVPLTDNQFAALVSFTFNLGGGALSKSTLLKKLNAGNYDAVPAELMKWVNDNGKRLKGLVNRRAAEAGLWAKDAFVSSNYVTPSKRVPQKEVAAIGGGGGIATATTIAPALPDIANAITGQQSELSSGNWLRIAIATMILGLTIWGIYQKVKA